MNPKLEAVLARLCESLGPITKTRAVKLPYLVDVVAQHVLGREIAGGTYQTWDYGVVTREVFAFIQHSGGDECLAVEEHRYSEGGLQIRRKAEPQGELTDQEKEVVDYVAAAYGGLDAGRLGALTKSLNPHLRPDDWGSNQTPELGEDAYARLSDGWQAFFAQLANVDLSDRSQWGEPIGDPREYLRKALGA